MISNTFKCTRAGSVLWAFALLAVTGCNAFGPTRPPAWPPASAEPPAAETIGAEPATEATVTAGASQHLHGPMEASSPVSEPLRGNERRLNSPQLFDAPVQPESSNAGRAEPTGAGGHKDAAGVQATWLDAGVPTVRGQNPPSTSWLNDVMPGSSGSFRRPLQPSEPGAALAGGAPADGGVVQPVQFTTPSGAVGPPPPPFIDGADPGGLLSPVGPTVPVQVDLAETRTGRFMFGVGVNSDLGLTGQIVVDERNFDFWNPPTSWDDVVNGRAWRGGGQGFRFEAMPGSQVQRYLFSFTEPYLFDTNVSLSLSGYFYDRRYFDWNEQRLGGRVALGYRLTPDLSTSAALRMENVNVHDARVLIPDLVQVLGDNSLFSGRFQLAHDTRDTPFFPSEGHYIELAYEQVFGTFEYPRGEVEFRQYFMIRERPDTSGRHTLAFSTRVGFSGNDTPLFEHYFAGGFSTMRGFSFRGASPVQGGVQVGGEFRWLNTAEYIFPLTADDMIKGVVFVDFGTVEEKIQLEPDDFRVSPGFGLRIAVPALGPAPLALDLAFPVAREDTDDIQNFSFYFGLGRS